MSGSAGTLARQGNPYKRWISATQQAGRSQYRPPLQQNKEPDMTTRYYGTNTEGNVYVTTDADGVKTMREYARRGNAIYVIQDVPGVTMFSEVCPDGVQPGESLEDAVRRMLEGEPGPAWAGKVVKWMGWLLFGILAAGVFWAWAGGLASLTAPFSPVR